MAWECIRCTTSAHSPHTRTWGKTCPSMSGKRIRKRDDEAGVRKALTDKGFQVSRGAAFAVLNVGAATAACKSELNLDIQVIALGETHDPSHAGIFGYTEHNTDAAATLARQVREVYPAAAFAQGS